MATQRNCIINYNKRPSDLGDLSDDIEVISCDGTPDTLHSSTTIKRSKTRTAKLSPKTISASQDDKLVVGTKRRRKTRGVTDEL